MLLFTFLLPQSILDLKQCISLDLFSIVGSSTWALAKWCLLMASSFFFLPLFYICKLRSPNFCQQWWPLQKGLDQFPTVLSVYDTWLFLIPHELTKARILLQLSSFTIPHSKRVGKNSRTHQSHQQIHHLFGDDPPRSLHEFSEWFHLFGRSIVTLNEIDPQVTIDRS